MVLYKNVLMLLCVCILNDVHLLLSSHHMPRQGVVNQVFANSVVMQKLQEQRPKKVTPNARKSKKKLKKYTPVADHVIVTEMAQALQEHNANKLNKIFKREIMARTCGSASFEVVMSVLALRYQAEQESRQLQIDRNRQRV